MSNERAIAIGKKIRSIREKRDLTQLEVANKSGLNISHYAKVERGNLKAGFDTLDKIAKALKFNVKDLL